MWIRWVWQEQRFPYTNTDTIAKRLGTSVWTVRDVLAYRTYPGVEVENCEYDVPDEFWHLRNPEEMLEMLRSITLEL